MVPITNKKCCVCADKEDAENEIFSCSGCNVNVHRGCYGIQCDYSEKWKCSLCEKGIRKSVFCKLCLQTGGAMKPTTVSSQFVHVVCGLFTDGVVFEDADLMEPINISNVSNNKRHKMCHFCKKSHGFSCLCANYKCNNRLHITCAKAANCLKEQLKKDGTIKFRAFCIEHKPKATDRKISSKSVRRVSMLIAKKKDEENKENCFRLNAEWILDLPGKNSVIVQKPNRVNDILSQSNFIVDEPTTHQKTDGKFPAKGIVDEKSSPHKAKSSANDVNIDSSKKKKRKAARHEHHSPKQQKLNKNRTTEMISNKVLTESPATSSTALNDIEGKFIKHSLLYINSNLFQNTYTFVNWF